MRKTETRWQAHGGPVSRRTFDEVMAPTYEPSDLVPVRGQGLDIWDADNNRYLDFTSGIGVTGLGHASPIANEALRIQAQTLWHVGNVYTNEPVLRLAQALTDATFADRAFFCNSGAEANEAALKLARKYAFLKFGPHKTRIVSCINAFHGRTLFTVSVGGQPKYTNGFGPLPEQITHVPFNDIAAAHAAIGDDVCAVLVEPVQGESGVLPASVEYLESLRVFCDRKGALLIFDEVQTGMGRTGNLFAYQAYDVIPDILTLAKALGNGYPIGAMLAIDEAAKAFSAGSHGTTYGGNPLAAAVGLAVLETVNTPAFLARVNRAAAALAQTLHAVSEDYRPMFTGVRGRGLMLGMVLSDAWAGRAKDIAKAAEAKGLMLLIAGLDVVRFLPALIVSDDQIREADRLLRRALDQLLAGRS
jgi:succinylornithine aminotransferase